MDRVISLITASWNRVDEPERLLKSLDSQSYGDFELIVADQNGDDRLEAVLRQHSRLRIHHIRLERGLSRARNAGLHLAHGEIIAFPDDDCWYPPELLAKVRDWFDQHTEFAVLFVATHDERGQLMSPKFPLAQGPCTKRSVLRCAVTFNAFVRAQAIEAIGFFREDIGPGTSSVYQSGEDLDYLIRPIEHGFRAWYEPSLAVYHPDFRSRPRMIRTTYPYSLGVGHVLRLHNYSWWVVGDLLLRSLCGAGIHFCKLDMEGARLYAVRAKGQFLGYFGQQHSTSSAAAHFGK